MNDFKGKEPILTIGIIERRKEIDFALKGVFLLDNMTLAQGAYKALLNGDEISLIDHSGKRCWRGQTCYLKNVGAGRFTLKAVVIGIAFHWQQSEDQTFEGDLKISQRDGRLTAINAVAIESYITSVISSEMSAQSPLALLKAHAIISRSWALSQLQPKPAPPPGESPQNGAHEIIRWYDRENHQDFDMCSDDHCQRYQGVSKISSPDAAKAVQETAGVTLAFDGKICDARFSKSCGGMTEPFENVWEKTHIPYLISLRDFDAQYSRFPFPLSNHDNARQWIVGNPPAYCNIRSNAIGRDEQDLLAQILPAFDQNTQDFYRWEVRYEASELQDILKDKSGIDFGHIKSIVPIERGPSGRLIKLQINGTLRSVVVGKELEIRRWLSKTHLYSSAFVANVENDSDDMPSAFTLRGAGWGHGVGLCQIGAAVMAIKGKTYIEILNHYFPGADCVKWY